MSQDDVSETSGTPAAPAILKASTGRGRKSDRAFIRIADVVKTFDGFRAVDHVDLDVAEGEIFCLLGGSGSGKSTLLRMLAGFETPDSGLIEIDGQDMTSVPPWERPVNMMFQSYALFPHMNVARNIAYGLKRDGLPRAEVEAQVKRMLDLVKLTPFAHRKPNQLSGGQRQRVALARALAKKPKALLLDEPLSALDKKLREETQFELMDIQETLGTTFIVVTHDQEEAMTLGERIGVMDQGRLIQVDAPRDLYEYPRNRFIADFVGSVNSFEGQVTEDESDHVRIGSEALGGEIYVHHGMSCQLGQTVWVAVRPEKLRMRRTPPEGPVGGKAQGVIEDIAYMGGLSHYRVVLPSGLRVRATIANRDRHDDDAVTWGDEVWISWPPEAGVALLS